MASNNRSGSAASRHASLLRGIDRVRTSALLLEYLPPALVVVSLSVVYLFTLAPGLTWANDGADGGDLIAAAATGGIAHPTGYPLYLLLAGLFQRIPIGSLAYRTNLMSAGATVLAALLIYRLVSRASAAPGGSANWLAGLISAFAVGLSPLIWSQAVITEVYALEGLIVALLLYLSAGSFPDAWAPRLDSLRGLVLGLGTGNHLTTLLLAPLMLAGSLKRGRLEAPAGGSPRFSPAAWYLDGRSLGRQAAFFAAGLLVYLVLPHRALASPPVNWGDPVTPARFWWLVSGALYRDQFLQLTAVQAWERIQAWSALLVQQFGISGVVLGLVGLVFFFIASRLHLITLWIGVVFSAFAIAFSSFDSYVYLIPAFMSFAVWIGLGAAGIMRLGHAGRPLLGWGVALVFLLYLLARSAPHWIRVDASRDARAETFGRQVLAAAPRDAIIFAKGDRAVFTMWYFHFAQGQRADLVVIAADLLHFDWYQETLRSVYPDLRLPGPLPWPESMAQANPALPVCYVEYVQRASISCIGRAGKP